MKQNFIFALAATKTKKIEQTLKKQSKIFLFGAGAILDWCGPTTSELTVITRESGFSMLDSDLRITEFIYQKLIKAGYNESEVNFETIINVIEELAIYYSEHNKKTQTPSLLRVFLNDIDLKKIFNFSIEGGERKPGYKLQIPKDFDCKFSYSSFNDENPNQFFLQHLLSIIITNINARISQYAYHTKGYSVIKENSEASVRFKSWMKEIEKENFIKLYTLNYDRIFKILLKNIGINCFEGFDVTENLSNLDGLRANVPKILNNSKCNVHYNLHGSAFWKVLALDKRQLSNPEIVYTGSVELPINSQQSNIQMEKGKPIYLTNIITGYQKAQKTILTPYKQMHGAFDKDCCNANKITIIGYSFGDEHINESIKTALRFNKKIKLEIISPNFIKEQMDLKLYLTIFQYLDDNNFQPKKISDNKYSYFNDKIIVYTVGFMEYLKQVKSRC